MSFRNVLQLLFAPNQLLEESLNAALSKKELEMQSRANVIVSGNGFGHVAKIDPKEVLTLNELIAAKRKALGYAVLWILTPAILGFTIAQAMNFFLTFSNSTKFCIRFISLLIVAFATFSRLGEIATFDGDTVPEKTNKLLFKLLYSFGFLLAVVGQFLDGD